MKLVVGTGGIQHVRSMSPLIIERCLRKCRVEATDAAERVGAPHACQRKVFAGNAFSRTHPC